MIKVTFHDDADDSLMRFAVIAARSDGKWVFCRHRDRDTLELPGGHREPGETVLEAARRELYEETGALEYDIYPVSSYRVEGNTRVNCESGVEASFGALFFADIHSFEDNLKFEITQVLLLDELPDNWTYPEIQPFLLEEVRRKGYIPSV